MLYNIYSKRYNSSGKDGVCVSEFISNRIQFKLHGFEKVEQPINTSFITVDNKSLYLTECIKGTYFVEILTTDGEQCRCVIGANSIEEAAMEVRMFQTYKDRAVGSLCIAVSIPGTNVFQFFYY